MSYKSAAVVCLVVLIGATAKMSASDFYEISIGARGFGGGNYLSEPAAPISSGRDLPFESGAGGWAAGGGLQSEFRILWGYLGLEFDMLLDHAENWCDVKYSSGGFWQENRYLYSFTTLRMPLLLKGNLGIGIVRFSLGTGPTFMVGIVEDTSVSITGSNVSDESQTDVGPLNDIFSARRMNDVLWTVSLGFAVTVWRLAVTLDFMYSYNLSQPDSYRKRVTIESQGNTLTQLSVPAQHTMDGRLLIGVSYEFNLD